MQVKIGKDTLGSGKKMTAEIANYERSTHNLSYVWRNTQAAGTLVPFMVQVAQPEDTWDIELQCEVLTHPTVGPLFGSFKVQLDLFTADMRLYNAQLHNNELNVGLKIQNVKFPIINLNTYNTIPTNDNAQINPSCILKYLGISGLGASSEQTLQRAFNAMPLIAYWDIFKNYYANRQEEYAYVIHTEPITINEQITLVNTTQQSPVTVPEYPSSGTGADASQGIRITYTTGSNPTIEQAMTQIIFYVTGGTKDKFIANELFAIGQSPVADQIWLSGVSDANINAKIMSWQYIDPNNLPTVPPNLVQFPLTIIDQMRTEILKKDPSSPLNINENFSLIPYRFLTQYTEQGQTALTHAQEGLAVKTYQSDVNNNWMNKEWFEQSGGINELTRVDVSEGYFTIDALAITKKVWTMLNRIALSGGSYNDWIEVQFTNRRFRNAEIPIYRGGLSKELVFQEVISNSASGDQPLGQLAGRGVMSKKHKGGQITIKTDEHTYIMGIVSLTPRICYSQGNEWFVNLFTMADLHVPALDQIGYQNLITDQMAWFDTRGADGNITFRSAGLQPAWINYMTNIDKAYGNFAIKDNEMFMTLNRRYENAEDGEFRKIGDLTTYIDPVKYNYIFAETSLDAMNFWVHIGVDATVRRKISAKVIPNL